jgi:hypothetical protein
LVLGNLSQVINPPETCRIVVCRGCCCGTAKKYPATDHDAQLSDLRQIRDQSGRRVPVRVSDCLGPCAEGNIVVVHPGPRQRTRGTKPVWFGFVLSSPAIEDLESWISAGGPGVAPLPDTLDLHRITAPGRRPGARK